MFLAPQALFRIKIKPKTQYLQSIKQDQSKNFKNSNPTMKKVFKK